MKNCFGYIRVSTQKQGEGVSLEAQKDAILAYAEHHELTISQWYEEKETAAKSGRPVFNAMLKALRQRKARGVVMHKIDRGARNHADWAKIGELADVGIDVYFATESLDFRSRGGRLTADIQAVIAADYIRNLRDETIKGLNGRLKQGLYPFRAPVGYLDNGRGQPKTPCPEKAPLIRLAFDLYASGHHSLRSLESEMNQRGLLNHSGKPLSLHGIETILKNPFYTGLIAIKRTGATYEGIHKPIVTAKTFKRAQDIRMGRIGSIKVTRHNHLYRGLFQCGLCSCPMSPELQKGRVYYRCHEPGCSTKTVREDGIEAAVSRRLEALQFTEADEAKLRGNWESWIASDDRSGIQQSIELQITKGNERLNRLTDLLMDDVVDREEYERRKKALLIDLARLEEERQKNLSYHLDAADMEKFIELMKNLAELHMSSKPDERRRMVRNLFSNRTVIRKTVQLEPHDWLQDREFSDMSRLVTHFSTALELLPSPANDNQPESVHLRMHNLRNQQSIKLQSAA